MAEVDKTELRQEYEQIWEDLEDLLRQVALVEGFQGNLSQILEFLRGRGIMPKGEYEKLTIHQGTLSTLRAGQDEDLTQGKVKELALLADQLRTRLRSFIVE